MRYTKNDRVLVVVNFDKTSSYKLSIKIPLDALDLMGLGESVSCNFKDLLSSNYNSSFILKDISNVKDRNAGVLMEIEPKSAYILQID